jgi:hypothetical protein
MKPSNIILDLDADSKLSYRTAITGPGLTGPLDAEQITCEGTSMGTPAHMSPEQADGRPADAQHRLGRFAHWLPPIAGLEALDSYGFDALWR